MDISDAFSTGDIMKYSVYFFTFIASPLFVALGANNLIKNKEKYTFKVLWDSFSFFYGAIVLNIFFIKLVFYVGAK